MTYVPIGHDATVYAPPAETPEPELYHPKTFIGKYIWSQDAHVIAIQYSITAIGAGLIALATLLLREHQPLRGGPGGEPSDERCRGVGDQPPPVGLGVVGGSIGEW